MTWEDKKIECKESKTDNHNTYNPQIEISPSSITVRKISNGTRLFTIRLSNASKVEIDSNWGGENLTDQDLFNVEQIIQIARKHLSDKQ